MERVTNEQAQEWLRIMQRSSKTDRTIKAIGGQIVADLLDARAERDALRTAGVDPRYDALAAKVEKLFHSEFRCDNCGTASYQPNSSCLEHEAK